jgi:hypothetical protein
MTIALDLRPQSRKTNVKKSIHLPRLVGLLLVSVFVLFSLATVATGLFFTRGLREERTRLERRVDDLQGQQLLLTEELKRLEALEKLYEEALLLLRDELPALEFLVSLEASLPPDLWLTKLTLSGSGAVVNGNGYAEADVVSFGRALTEASVVRSVGLPVTSRFTAQGESRVRFDLSCVLNDLESVTAPQGAEP